MVMLVIIMIMMVIQDHWYFLAFPLQSLPSRCLPTFVRSPTSSYTAGHTDYHYCHDNHDYHDYHYYHYYYCYHCYCHHFLIDFASSCWPGSDWSHSIGYQVIRQRGSAHPSKLIASAKTEKSQTEQSDATFILAQIWRRPHTSSIWRNIHTRPKSKYK